MKDGSALHPLLIQYTDEEEFKDNQGELTH